MSSLPPLHDLFGDDLASPFQPITPRPSADMAAIGEWTRLLDPDIDAQQDAGGFSKYVSDPVRFVDEVLRERLWSKQRDIMESVRDNKRTAVRSCHDSGKSFTAARVVCWWLATHPIGEAFVITTAPTAAQVRSILWREINRAHAKGKLPGRTNQTEWYMETLEGAEQLVAIGRKPADHQPAAFQGIHDRYVLVVIDEAGGVADAMFDAVETLVTNNESRILAIGNPDIPDVRFQRCFEVGSGWATIQIKAWDTPAFTGEDVPANVLAVLLSKEWVEDQRWRGESSAFWQAKIEAEFPRVADGPLFKRSMFRSYTELADRIILITPQGPVEIGKREGVIFVTVDLAASIKTYADYTVFGVWQWAKGSLILRDLIRDKIEAPEQLSKLAEIQALWRPAFIAIEKTGYQLAAIQSARREGLTVTELTPDKDKFSRAVAFAAKAVSGQVYFPATSAYREILLAELCAFPNAANDDQVDVCSYAADEAIDMARSAKVIPIVGV